jgi:hypothetical protein
LGGGAPQLRGHTVLAARRSDAGHDLDQLELEHRFSDIAQQAFGLERVAARRTRAIANCWAR